MNTLFNTSEAILDFNMDSEAFVASGILNKGTKKTFTFVEFANKGFGSVNVSDNDDIGTGDIVVGVFLASDKCYLLLLSYPLQALTMQLRHINVL